MEALQDEARLERGTQAMGRRRGRGRGRRDGRATVSRERPFDDANRAEVAIDGRELQQLLALPSPKCALSKCRMLPLCTLAHSDIVGSLLVARVSVVVS